MALMASGRVFVESLMMTEVWLEGPDGKCIVEVYCDARNDHRRGYYDHNEASRVDTSKDFGQSYQKPLQVAFGHTGSQLNNFPFLR